MSHCSNCASLEAELRYHRANAAEVEAVIVKGLWPQLRALFELSYDANTNETTLVIDEPRVFGLLHQAVKDWEARGALKVLEEMRLDADAMYFRKEYGSPNSALSMHMAWRNAVLKYAQKGDGNADG